MAKFGTILFQYIRLVWILGLHVLFVSLLLSRALGEVSWSWFLVFIPLFVFDGLCVVYWVMYLVFYILNRLNSDYDDDDYGGICFPRQKVSLVVLIFYAIGLPLKLAAEILLCFALMSSVPFYVPGILLTLLFTEIGCVLMYYTLKPTFTLIQRHW